MKSIFFDAGPIISLAMNNLLWLLQELKKVYPGDFYISQAVKKEVIDKPFSGKRFKFEAMQVMSVVESKVLEVNYDKKIEKISQKLMDVANKCFMAKGNYIQIVHMGEIETLAGAIVFGSELVVIDERTTRLLIENPNGLLELLQHKLHMPIKMVKENIAEFSRLTKNIRISRSVELAVIAYEKGILDRLLPQVANPKKELLDGVLWGIKLNGCSVSRREIEQILKIETKK